jgi:hypothetical protein
VGEERGRSCPTVGNNRVAAFRPRVEEEDGYWRRMRGSSLGGHYSTSHLIHSESRGWGISKGEQNGGRE